MSRSLMKFMVKPYLWVSLVVVFLFLPTFPWATLSGGGMNSTLNLLVWLFTALAVPGLTVFLHRRHIRGGQVMKLLLAGAFLMTLPVGWEHPELQSEAFPRLAGLWAMVGLLWLFLQVPVTCAVRRCIYAVVVTAGLIQSCLAIWQVLFPVSAGDWLLYDALLAGGRPLGGLLQANLLGSFLATALSCAAWLWLSASWHYSRCRGVLTGLAVAALCVGLVLTRSRTMQTATVLTLVLLVLFSSADRWRKGTLMLWLFAGLFAGMMALQCQPGVLLLRPAVSPVASPATRVVDRLAHDRLASDRERLVMLNGTISLIREHPVAGSGLGSFETRFPAALTRAGIVNPFTVTVLYPHNELLYVWSEGGIVALFGLLLWLVVWALPFISGLKGWFCRTRRISVADCQQGARRTFNAGLLTLPLMIHVMTEFPLYLSALHGVLLVLMLRMSLPARMTIPQRGANTYTLQWRLRRVLSLLLTTVGLAAAAFIATGLQSARVLQEAETFSLMDASLLADVSNSYSQPDRLQFDRAVSYLMQFNQTRNPEMLTCFQTTASRWLAVHNDANLIWSMMRISQGQQDRLQAQYWQRRGCQSFASDSRFDCGKSVVLPIPGRRPGEGNLKK